MQYACTCMHCMCINVFPVNCVHVAHDITYLDPFLGACTGSLYITDYKMYFKSSGDDKGVSTLGWLCFLLRICCSTCKYMYMYMCSILIMNLHACKMCMSLAVQHCTSVLSLVLHIHIIALHISRKYSYMYN